MSGIKKYIIIIIGVLFILSCSNKSDEITSATWTVDESKPELSVEVLNITTGSLYSGVQAAGVISGVMEAYIVSETKGIIENVSLGLGDSVEKNQEILKVDNTIARLSLEQTKQQFESAKLELDSIESLYKKGISSLQELTRARSSYNGALAIYETSLKSFNDSSIKSPIGGVIAWKESSAALGNYITPGMIIARVVDLSSLKIELSVGERQIGLIDLGAKATIKISALNSIGLIEGYVSAIAGGSELSTGSYSLIVSADNNFKDKIKAGMSVVVEIETNNDKNGIIIPNDSIVLRDKKEYIFIDDNGVATPKEIKKIDVLGNRALIASNETIKINDKIITTGLSAIKPGSKVISRLSGNTGDAL